MIRAVLCFSVLILLIGCSETTTTPTLSIKKQIDAVDNITGVNNWKWVHDSDTSYLYFSRIGDQKINVYHFRIVGGDSTGTELHTIEAVDDTIRWNRGAGNWYLISTNDSSMSWGVNGLDAQYQFVKLDSIHILFHSPDHTADTLQQTLPLSTFLVRSKYDFEHGTSQVDSGLVSPRGIGE